MPIYEYKCEQCSHQLEILQKISDGPAKTCPECGKDSLRKLVSAAAFKLKGTGWYETDFKDKKPKKDAKTATDKKDGSGKKMDNATKSTTETSTKSTETAKSSNKAARSE